MVKFLEEQLHLQRLFLEQPLFPKNCSFRVLLALIFFLGTAVFGNSIYLKHKYFVIFCLVLMRVFQNSPNKLHINSGWEKIASPRFHVVSFACNNCWIKQNQETHPTLSLLYFWCSFEILQYFGVKTLPARDMKRCYLEKEIWATIRDFKKALFMNYIVTLQFTRKIL